MSMALVLRNASKINAASFLRTASLAPLKTYTTVNTAQPSSKQLALVKNVAPLARSISLSAPRMSGMNHGSLWAVERAVNVALIGIIPAAFLAPSQAMDTLLATTVVLHQHWGIEAMITDYVRASVLGPLAPRLAMISLYLLSVTVLGGLLYFIYNDIGIANAIKKIWEIKEPEPVPEPEPAKKK